MDSSSSATTSSSNSQYTGAVFPASTTGRPRWPDLTIYDSTPHYPPPPMDNNNNNSRLLANPSPSYSTSAYEYGTYNYAGSTAEKREEDGGGEERGERSEFMAVEREHMFDKVVTPSDVGKLNRLVIPKQHAEKYFPLDSNSGDSKGLLLNFEDRTGKSWRFRYSYWNSSQSYVMTKGWSRFVKEKKLDAGDIVSFHRGVGDSAAKSSFYIDWRRRPDAPPSHHYPLYPRGGGVGMQFHHPHHPAVDASQFQHGFGFHRPINHAHPYYLSHPIIPPPPGLHQAQARFLNLQRGSVVSYNGVTNNNYNSSTTGPGGGYGPNFCTPQQTGSVVYLGAPHQQMQMAVPGSGGSSSRREEAMVFDSVPVVHGGKAAAAASSSSSSSKRLRLFGVNMDCTEPQDECDVTEHINRHHQQQNQHDLVLDSDRISSSSSDSALQLRLHGSGVSAASPSTTSDFVDKGKSSMSLDLDLDLDM